MKHDVFISYRRDGGEYTAKILRDRLQELGYRVFFDVESLRSGDFNTKLYSEIDECEDFLLILSPNALDRCVNNDDWVRREIEYALSRDKNVIPVMLRGFSFPEKLPESLEPLRYKNGLEANSQFFEAFIQKLQQFLKTKPPLWQRISQNNVIRKTIPLFLALFILSVIVMGVTMTLNSWNTAYPRTNAQKNLTGEAIYYVGINLNNINLIADTMDRAYKAAERYISSGSTDAYKLEKDYQACWNLMEQVPLESGIPSEKFLDRLSESPFEVAEFEALYEATGQFYEECSSNLEYLEIITDADFFLSNTDKLEMIECYQVIFEETLKIYANSTNQMFLPITNHTALDEFYQKVLPNLSYIPLSISNWEQSKETLVIGSEECFSKIEEATQDLAVLLGNNSVENVMMEEALIFSYMNMGYTKEEAEDIVKKRLELQEKLDKLREINVPKDGDSAEVLWGKMTSLMTGDLHEEALECLEAFWQLMKDNDPYAKEYVPAMKRFIESIPKTGIDYGAIVTAYDSTGSHDVLQIGDVIISFDGTPCYSNDTYIEKKAQLTTSEYILEILRADEEGELERITLELTTDMPRIGISAVTNKRYE